MKIMITNDDGIHAPGLWELVREVSKVAEVIVVAPDREQSAIGTAITLHQPLRAQKVAVQVPGVEAYAVAGTPSDSVILGLRKLASSGIDLVISGINNGPNVGTDVLISGTVGAALQAYLQGFPAVAVSIDGRESPNMAIPARLTALLVRQIAAGKLPAEMLLNVNVPDLPMDKIKGMKLTRFSSDKYASTIKEEHDGKKEYYWLEHRMIKNRPTVQRNTDASAIARHEISLTPLHIQLFQRSGRFNVNGLCGELFSGLQSTCESAEAG